MRIYKGDVGVELTVQSFLDFLEEDALDEIIQMIIYLEEEASMYDDDGDFTYLGGPGEDISELFEHITGNIEHYEIMSEDEYNEMFGMESFLSGPFTSDEDILDNLLLSNEDLRVKRIVERFSHVKGS